MTRFLAALALLGTAGDVLAGCPVVRQKAVVVETAVAVTPVAVATFVPVTVAAYSASYQPQASTDPAVVELIRQIDRRLAAVEGGAVVQANASQGGAGLAEATAPRSAARPKADVAPDPGATRFVANCAKCHSDAAAKGGFTLFRNGQPVALTCEQALACTGAIAAGTMPKGGKLERDEDGPEILVWLAKQAQAKK